MPKSKDLRLHGVKFEDALKKILAVSPLPKKPKAKSKKPVHNPQLN